MSSRKVAVVGIPQTRGMRYIAMPMADFVRVQCDPALIDSVDVLGCLDVNVDETREWARSIDGEHRLIYKVNDDEIQIAKCRFHYD